MSTKNLWKFPWYLILVFVILSTGILTIGYLYYKNQEAYIRKEKQQELAAIIALKIDQIISWRQERIDYAGTIMDDPFLAMRVRDFIKGRANPVLKRQILERLAALVSYQYQSLALIDPQGNVRLSVPVSKQELTPYLKSLASQAMQSQKVVFSDLHSDDDSKVMLSVLTPLLAIQGNEKVIIGVILMRIEPYQFLYPLIKSWPTPSLTGETELVRREGDEVVFLNELRHRQNIPLNLRFPVDSPNLLAAMIARGKKGIVEGFDYRGIPVLAAAGLIPDSPWFLVAKIDADEIYAPLKKRVGEVVFLLITLITTAGISVAYFWRNQQTRFYRRQYEVERDRIAERQRTEEVLKESEKNLRHLASQLLRAQEDERKRISQELHDELGHALLALKLQAESVEEQLLPQQVALKNEVGKILRFIGATIEEVRRLYLDLSPGDLEDLGLTTALHSLVDDFAELQKQIKWTINLDYLDGLFPLSTQTAIYRIVQEALTNIGKHAKPKHVYLKIKRAKSEVSFTLVDDGIGFERNKVVPEKKTLGLLAMEERVKILGGSFDLQSQENHGTRISFTIPIPGGS